MPKPLDLTRWNPHAAIAAKYEERRRMASAKAETARGFSHRCPMCGEADSLRIDVADVHALTCVSCDDSITSEDLREIARQYERLLAWLDTAPAISE
jgi:predicted RNA-binding Zn-ribbon protein involved in translation (DUF1610 family)